MNKLLINTHTKKRICLCGARRRDENKIKKREIVEVSELFIYIYIYKYAIVVVSFIADLF